MFRRNKAGFPVVRITPIPANVSDSDYVRALTISGLMGLMEKLYPTVSSQQN
jgi:hypothetical protein